MGNRIEWPPRFLSSELVSTTAIDRIPMTIKGAQITVELGGVNNLHFMRTRALDKYPYPFTNFTYEIIATYYRKNGLDMISWEAVSGEEFADVYCSPVTKASFRDGNGVVQVPHTMDHILHPHIVDTGITLEGVYAELRKRRVYRF